MFSTEEMTWEATELQAALSRWDGCIWRLAGYSMSHPTFAIWIYAFDRPTRLNLECIHPRYICGPMGWHGCRFTVRVQQAEPLNYFVIRDDAANFEIHCQHVRTGLGPPPHWVKLPSAGE